MKRRTALLKNEMIDVLDRQWLDYDDGDIFVVDNVAKLPERFPGTIASNKIIVIVCYQGQLHLRLNEQPFVVQQDEAAICYPERPISGIQPSEDVRCLAFGFSVQTMDNAFYTNEKVWKSMFKLSTQPIIHLTDDELTILFHFAEIAKIKIAQQRNPLQKRVMHSLLQTVLFEFFDIIARYNQVQAETPPATSRNQLFKQFMELLVQNNGRIQSVAEMAAKLNVSPKHLSHAMKQNSDKSPLEWIQFHTLNAIVQQLRYTDRSIKDIATSLGFTNQSTFGKFVKHHLGMSPREYRTQFNLGAL